MIYHARRFWVLCTCIFITGALSGCAGPAANINKLNGPVESLRPGYEVVYHPQLQSDQTWDMVFDNLKRTLNGTIWASFNDDYLTNRHPSKVKNLAFLENRVEISHRFENIENNHSVNLFYYQLLNIKIVLEFAKDSPRAGYSIILPEVVTFRVTDLSTAQRIADALFFWQQQVKNLYEKQKKQLALFEPIAAQYRALSIKPPVIEEQRRLIVQANALSQQKKYKKAIDQYRKVVELDQVAYPEAYFNLALLAAQENLPLSAIFYMKHYLLLVPDAKDARSAQDKIYEWEIMIQK